MNASISTERLIKDLKLVARDAEDLMRATASDVSEKAKEARARLVAALDTAKLTCEAWQDKAAAGAKAADKVVRDHPYQSLGVVFGVGLLIGVLVNRRSRD